MDPMTRPSINSAIRELAHQSTIAARNLEQYPHRDNEIRSSFTVFYPNNMPMAMAVLDTAIGLIHRGLSDSATEETLHNVIRDMIIDKLLGETDGKCPCCTHRAAVHGEIYCHACRLVLAQLPRGTDDRFIRCVGRGVAKGLNAYEARQAAYRMVTSTTPG